MTTATRMGVRSGGVHERGDVNSLQKLFLNFTRSSNVVNKTVTSRAGA